jgi:hypothetical protein
MQSFAPPGAPVSGFHLFRRGWPAGGKWHVLLTGCGRATHRPNLTAAAARPDAACLLTNFLAAGDNAVANGCTTRPITAGAGGSVRKQRVWVGSRAAGLTPPGSREAP